MAKQQTDIEALPPGEQPDSYTEYNVPEQWTNLDELAVPAPVPDTSGQAWSHSNDFEATRLQEQQRTGNAESVAASRRSVETGTTRDPRASRAATWLYTISYLVFFSMLGTLARLGLAALTSYPGAPVIFSTLWANVGGSLVMGFLAEERVLFRHGFGGSEDGQHAKPAEAGNGSGLVGQTVGFDSAATKKAHLAMKKTVPLYIGLATGFCGSFTSFSSFVRDAFLALSNDMTVPGVDGPIVGRNGGYSFMAMLAVVITTVALSLAALIVGGHLAAAMEPITSSLSYRVVRKILDPLVVILAWGCWLGAAMLSIFPPHDAWRGITTFSLVFAPLGCLARFYLALHLNGRVASFPVGTFAANVAGTAVLGIAWDIAHAPVGGTVACQVLQGVEDGFCGCLTTVSTWVAELSGLRRRHAYVYGTASVVVSLVLLIAIMGGLAWSLGFSPVVCTV
ncbi:hypothetical protein S40288_09269 [Stachybotrys chartarum IBT 40288]|nr:hypothetical protein S40288_09269 [Stachybotrys chartarum IBT 40288]